MSFEKKMIIGMVIAFIVMTFSIFSTVNMVLSHSHEIASDAGSLAHDCMKAAKDNTK